MDTSATTPARQRTTGSDAAAPSAPKGSTSLLGRALLALVLLLAAASACGAVLPAPFRRRFPALTRKIAPYREFLGAGAAALMLGVLVGVAMS